LVAPKHCVEDRLQLFVQGDQRKYSCLAGGLPGWPNASSCPKRLSYEQAMRRAGRVPRLDMATVVEGSRCRRVAAANAGETRFLNSYNLPAAYRCAEGGHHLADRLDRAEVSRI